MPFWPFGRKPGRSPSRPLVPHSQGSLQDLEHRAWAAYYGERWAEAEPLFQEMVARADPEGRQKARYWLGLVYERLGRVDDAIAVYETNLNEQCPGAGYLSRLAIIYRHHGQASDERRICVAALEIIPQPKGREWFAKRLHKIK